MPGGGPKKRAYSDAADPARRDCQEERAGQKHIHKAMIEVARTQEELGRSLRDEARAVRGREGMMGGG